MATPQRQTLNGLRATKGYYTTREIAEIYHVTPTTVCNFPQAVEDFELRKEELIEQSRRYWVRLIRQLNK